MTGAITFLGMLALITVLPIKLAADFTDGQNAGLLSCAFAALVAPALSLFIFRMLNGGFPGFVLAFAVGISAYVTILRIPSKSVVGFCIVTIALQLAVFAALISFGVHIGEMLLP